MPQRIDKEGLAKRIRELEGLNNDEKSTLLELLNASKKYGLVWEEKVENTEEALRDNLPVLAEDKTLALTNGGEDAPNHILIEGDNLEALTTLSYTHEGKIDVIYIDPPYNTGNKDFVYNDSFVDSEDSYRHSKWLSFMSKRLRIAKHLLSDRGVIFISINTIEFAQLKLMCDDIFSERNFIGHITWESTTQPTNAGSAKYGLQQKNESIFLYAKIKDNVKGFNLKSIDKTLSYPHKGKFGACRLEIIEKSDAGAYNRESMKFPILGHYPREGKRWQIGQDTADDLVCRGRIEIDNGIVKKAVYPEDETDRLSFEPFWSHLSSDIVGTAQNGKDELNTLMGKAMGFDTVKPVDLIQKLIFHSSNCNSIVLDFFAGSGTTLHAVMQLNKEDGGKRQCILVTNNENNICRDVTYERNKRVINGYTTPKGQEVEGLKQNNLRYYRTHLLPRERTNRNMRALVNASTDLLCIKEGIYQEEREFAGLKFKPSVARYFHQGDNRMLVIYNESAIQLVVQHVAECGATKEHPIKIYTFSDGPYAYNDEFKQVLPLVELCALPEAIYQVYRNVLPKRKHQAEPATTDLSDTEAVREAMEDNYDYKEGGAE